MEYQDKCVVSLLLSQCISRLRSFCPPASLLGDAPETSQFPLYGESPAQSPRGGCRRDSRAPDCVTVATDRQHGAGGAGQIDVHRGTGVLTCRHKAHRHVISDSSPPTVP